METMTAIGLLLGPMIGQAMNNTVGDNAALAYQLPFYVLSGVFILCIYTIRWLPPDIKNKVEIDKVRAIDCMKNSSIFWTFSIMTACATTNTFINPQYTEHMESLGLGKDYSGYVVTIGALFYIVFLHLMPIISKKLDKKFIITIGTLISIFAVLVQAPEKYLGFPQGGGYWYLVTIGQSINGISSAMVILPMIPELIELIVINEMKLRNVTQPDLKMIRACSDMGSSIFVGGYALGTFIGPFGAGLLYDAFKGSEEKHSLSGFLYESRIFAVFIVVIMICYVTLGKGYVGIVSTLKKLKICKRKKTQHSESVIIQRTANNLTNNDTTINKGVEDNTTIINTKDNNKVDEVRESIDDSKYKLINAQDALLSDNFPIDFLSAGDGSQDVENQTTLDNLNAQTNGGNKEKNTYYFE